MDKLSIKHEGHDGAHPTHGAQMNHSDWAGDAKRTDPNSFPIIHTMPIRADNNRVIQVHLEQVNQPAHMTTSFNASSTALSFDREGEDQTNKTNIKAYQVPPGTSSNFAKASDYLHW